LSPKLCKSPAGLAKLKKALAEIGVVFKEHQTFFDDLEHKRVLLRRRLNEVIHAGLA
jgi:hypothetical protein